MGQARRVTRPALAQVVWSDSAIAGVVAIRAFIAEEDPGAAASIAAELVAAGDSLALFPFRGSPVVGGRHKLVVRPYLIFYRVTAGGENVRILAVVDGRRERPGETA
jgi:toxin ParE1/3/4